jgi:sialate O-acetylesterase
MRIAVSMMAAVLAAACVARADVRLPAIFSDHMVIQSGTEVAVWGWASPEERIGVKLGSHSMDVKADAEGQWLARFPPIKADEHVSLTVEGRSNSVEVNDIVGGEVWLACGQSNMAYGLNGAIGGREAAAEANYPSIHLFTVGRVIANQPKADCGGSWRMCTPQTAGGFSAVGFFFARRLQNDRGVPVGIINASLNGTTCEAWTRKQALLGDKDLRLLVDKWDAKVKAYDPTLETERFAAAMAAYRAKLKLWEQEDANAKAQGLSSPRKPQMPSMVTSPLDTNNYPGNCYNGMISPLTRFPVRGVIWYQGESNAGEPLIYTRLFSTLIADWRRQWNAGDMPFIFVQLPWRGKSEQGDAEESWAAMREAQARVLSLPRTAMVVTVDNAEGILHPRDKRPIGERLAVAAGALVYGSKVTARGPVYSQYMGIGDTVMLTFSHTDGGLVAKGGRLTGFSVAGKDRRFVPAQAKIVDGKVEVRADGVVSPASVRYGWMNSQTPTLCNGLGLPAEPFRTDNWKLDEK